MQKKPSPNTLHFTPILLKKLNANRKCNITQQSQVLPQEI